MKLSKNGKALLRNLSAEWRSVDVAWSSVENLKRADLVEDRYTDTGAAYKTLWLRLNERGLAAQRELSANKKERLEDRPDLKE
jgi:hypothetical protein